MRGSRMDFFHSQTTHESRRIFGVYIVVFVWSLCQLSATRETGLSFTKMVENLGPHCMQPMWLGPPRSVYDRFNRLGVTNK